MGEARVETEEGVATLLLDGFPQSAVDLEDETVLHFEYVQHLALALDVLRPGRSLRVTHVGGGALSLPRWVALTRPGSPQVVLEPDAALTELVRRRLPLPRGHRIRVRPVGGAEGMAALRDASADVVVLDAFVDGRLPAELSTLEWLSGARRVLGPTGLLLANVPDEPGLRYLARVAAGAHEAFGHSALLGLQEVLKGRRFGNVVLLASSTPLDLYTLRRAAASAPLPTGVLSRAELVRRAPGARPLLAGEGGMPSPPPPDPRAWRRR
ncbi:fused MFS/spermidine synthase [Phycicoccus endophyticus]|uniref:Fused MFS/spermidine synthase n=1 Tax=Phycicoccus endophyticus TaxID=1690220 RepID=A0A7G9R063_9MICO|nr:fused MFS/spermidine synthase [Phycicoccus endophyticus]NHI20219.1 hypothetical protein [Phycicoccus endophyticus]QNN48988.1 fused MFS/spermidine synthase [Phycicoccus endophyticus]GGL44301.1 hypothetical protein GCM10012283_28650 [Phycicoccus endophyticus]